MIENMELQDEDDYYDSDFDSDEYDEYDDFNDPDNFGENQETITEGESIQTVSPMVSSPVKSAKIRLSDLVQFVLFYISFARLDGKLCYYNERTHCYMTVKSKDDVEAVIYRKYPQILNVVSSAMLSSCARVIYKLEEFPDQEPSEAEGCLGFLDGIYVYNKDTGKGYNFSYFSFLDSLLKNPEKASFESTAWDNSDVHEFPDLFTVEWWKEYNDAAEEFMVKQNRSRAEIGAKALAAPDYSKGQTLPVKITHTLNATFKNFSSVRINARPGQISSEAKQGIEFAAPATTAFFHSISEDDKDLLNRIWEVLACILVPDPTIKKFFLLSGVPDSGKSVLGNFIKGFFAKENVSSLDFTRLGDRYSASALPGTYLNMSMDLPNRVISLKTIAMLKMLTGDDDVTVEAKFENVASYRNRCRFLFASNHDLRLLENDQAFLNRLVVIPFSHRIPAEKQDRNLLSRLLAERDVVASFAVQVVYPSIKARHFIFSGSDRPEFQPSIIYPDAYMSRQEAQIQKFIEENCSFTGNNRDHIYTRTLYDHYESFCAKESFNEVCDIKQFSRIFGRLAGPKVVKRRFHTSYTDQGERIERNQYGYTGVRLRTDPLIFNV